MHTIALARYEIEKLLHDFHTITHIRISFISDGYREYVSSYKTMCPFCILLRKDKLADSRCKTCDAAAFKTVEKSKRTFIYQCHMGMWEAVSPVTINGKLLGYLMLGHVLKNIPDGEGWESMEKKCRQFETDLNALKDAYFKLNVLDPEQLHATVNLMEMIAKYISMSGMVRVSETPILEKLKAYMEDNYDKPISVFTASGGLKVSKSHISHILMKNLGITFTGYLNLIRVEKAKSLIEQTNMRISDIAQAAGFSDANYFARVFRQITKCSPSDYRKFKIK